MRTPRNAIAPQASTPGPRRAAPDAEAEVGDEGRFDCVLRPGKMPRDPLQEGWCRRSTAGPEGDGTVDRLPLEGLQEGGPGQEGLIEDLVPLGIGLGLVERVGRVGRPLVVGRAEGSLVLVRR